MAEMRSASFFSRRATLTWTGQEFTLHFAVTEFLHLIRYNIKICNYCKVLCGGKWCNKQQNKDVSYSIFFVSFNTPPHNNQTTNLSLFLNGFVDIFVQ